MSEETIPTQIKIPESITVKKFAEVLELSVSEVIMELMKNKIMATINDEIDFETASIIAEDLGFSAEKDLTIEDGASITLDQLLQICQEERKSDKKLSPRPPVVTFLGHVDHGKTTLLDTIRKANVAEGESGGITQHMSAYQTKKRGKSITFIDTPGHEAFATLRQRGVSLADIAILVVAADDGVRPQTKEVITYLKEKKIPTIVAITKMDKPEANPTRVKEELSKNDIVTEEWGGDTMCISVSAKTKKGLDELLESILLVSEMEDLNNDTDRDGLGVVLESHLDAKKGPVTTILVKTGAFKTGQDILAGKTPGRIRKMEDWQGNAITKALPAMPVTIMGLESVPQANDVLQVLTHTRASEFRVKGPSASLTNTTDIKESDERKRLQLILKADTQGSLEAILQILNTYVSDEVVIQYLETGVGNITESDIKLAKDSEHMLIYGFHVEITTVAKRLAENTAISLKTYTIIYELVEDIKKHLESMLEPEIIRTDYGTMKVLAIFKTGKTDMIVGGKVTKGKAVKDALIEVYRGEDVIGRGTLSNLQQNKVDVPEVKKDKECGITFQGETKIQADDMLHIFSEQSKKKYIGEAKK